MNVNYFGSRGISVQDGSLPSIEWLSRDHILLEMRYSLARPLRPKILLPPPTVSDAEDAVNLPTFSLALAIISLNVSEPMSERKPKMR